MFVKLKLMSIAVGVLHPSLDGGNRFPRRYPEMQAAYENIYFDKEKIPTAVGVLYPALLGEN